MAATFAASEQMLSFAEPASAAEAFGWPECFGIIFVLSSLRSDQQHFLNHHIKSVPLVLTGNSLGLYIVKEVAEMHHGELGYHVADGKVAFELSIPA